MTTTSSASISTAAVTNRAMLEVRGLEVRHTPRGEPLVASVDFNIAAGEIVALMGPNGTGKTSLLRHVGATARAGAPQVELSAGATLALTFQQGKESLFPWLTLLENCQLASRLRGGPCRERADFEHLAASLGCSQLPWDRLAAHASGGESQLCDLLRALGTGSRVLLLDEPFGQVDGPTRSRLFARFRNLVRSEGLAVLLVTHEIEDIEALADRVLLLAGRPATIVAARPVERAERRRSPLSDVLEALPQPAESTKAAALERRGPPWRLLVGAVVLVGGWQLLTMTGAVPVYLLPPPARVASALAVEVGSADFPRDVTATTGRAIGTFGLAVVLGMPAGLWLGRHLTAWRWTSPWLDIVRSVPPPLMLPILALFFGLGEVARISTIAMAATAINLIYAAAASRNLPPQRLEVVRWLGLDRSFGRFLRSYLLPETLPALIAAARVSLVVCWILAVVVEMFGGASHGLGAEFMLADSLTAAPRRYALLLVLTLLSACSNAPLAAAAGRCLAWSGAGKQ